MVPRIVKFTAGFVGGTAAEAAFIALGWKYYTKDTKFVPFTSSSADFTSPIAKKLNPFSNPPLCIDHAVRTVPLSQLRTTDEKELTTDFCRGVWSGPGFALQRIYLARKYKALSGREKHLWEKDELKISEYPVGTVLVDHFEVVDRTPNKVTVRCGDSPLIREPRPSDGLFTIEVTKDEANQTATFHLKSIFVNTSADGKNAEPLPPRFIWAHKEYTKLWMETSVRKLLK
ncbi:uncharacterized protein BDZ99DRAFT_147995 [Mytilinidion resinicola]|uniref:Uncharacterized protein n=1 Tax=Mytilinidion resinicola TaxID=574789 RepID=A0A6A6Y7R1_9PEZI|nr:uncharacterized protein BDZ99DRAFT_147995 [Mytilinidion resinicola]KAF2804588.1 hypothetical protein BDZ99DRAFT_147995 [Mytilinidion resinicola]